VKLVPMPNAAATIVSEPYSKRVNKPRLPGSSSPACSRTPLLGLHWLGLPELRAE
jgi:hypothetical protein